MCKLNLAVITPQRTSLLAVGGDSLHEVINRILRKIFTNELALSWSMWGLKGNENFSKLKIWEIIKGARSVFHNLFDC